MSQSEKRNLERVRYWQGQMLRSRDFNGIHAVEEQRRWWHNRAMHNAYGIHQDDPRPFTVTLNPDNTAVTVTPGLAYDSFGRELVLQTNQTVPLPVDMQTEDKFLLLIRYQMQRPHECTESVSAICYTDDVPARPSWVEFAWKRPDKFSFVDGVPLITLLVTKGERMLQALREQPSLRPLARPQLGSGSTIAGNTPWELWTSGVQNQRILQAYGVQTTIDTSAAGFTDAPCYFAWLQGSVFNPQTRRLARAIFTSIAEESVNSFVFRIALSLEQAHQIIPLAAIVNPQRVSFVRPEDFALFAHQQGLYVNWVGCQKNASAPFVFTFALQPWLWLGRDVLQLAGGSLDLRKIDPKMPGAKIVTPE